MSESTKEALTGLKDQIASRISTPAGQTIGQVLKPNVTGPASKPSGDGSPANKPSGPTYNYLSGWDRFKNTLSKIGKIGGLTTHEITDDDYVKNPKTGKMEFSWAAARESDKRRGLATKT